MNTVLSLSALAEQLRQAAEVVDNYLLQRDCGPLTYAIEGKHDLSDAPSAVQDARRQIMEKGRTIVDLLSGPHQRIQQMCSLHLESAAYRWLYHFQVHNHVPLQGAAISFTELAKTLHVEESKLRRIMRFMITRHLYCEPQPGYVAHTIDSSLIASNKNVNGYVGYNLEETFPASVKLVEATEKFSLSEESNHTAWNLAFDTELPIFEYFNSDPGRAERFAGTMKYAAEDGGFHIDHIKSYPWTELGPGTVVDVGGSLGHASVAIAQATSNLCFVVQDLESTIDNSSTLPDDLRGRITFASHNFFCEQPIKNAAAYLLRWILHDHLDNVAIKIIRNLVPAMSSESSIIVMDIVLPEPNTVSLSEQRLVRLVDMEMLTNFNSRERELEDWKMLFKTADPRLCLKKVVKPQESAMSLIEFTLS